MKRINILYRAMFGAALLIGPIASANTTQNNNVNNAYQNNQHTERTMPNSIWSASNTAQPNIYIGNVYGNNGASNSQAAPTRQYQNNADGMTAKQLHFAKVFSDGQGTGTVHQMMKASRMARRYPEFHQIFDQEAPKFYKGVHHSRSMAKQLKVSWRILYRFSKRSKTYRKGWHTPDSSYSKCLNHRKAYRKGFRDSMKFEFGTRAPIHTYFHEYREDDPVSD